MHSGRNDAEVCQKVLQIGFVSDVVICAEKGR